LGKLGLVITNVRNETKNIVGHGEEVGLGRLPQTSHVRFMFQRAVEEARVLRDNSITTEHILLGMLRDEDCVSAEILTKQGVSRGSVRTELLAFRDRHPVESNWLDRNSGAAFNIACAIVDERRWETLPILADALEEAGCTDLEMLAHLRTPANHQSGCWVLDRLLAEA
jgi:ATP-dependent Clp protease ATP-binding subunit ClpA